MLAIAPIGVLYKNFKEMYDKCYLQKLKSGLAIAFLKPVHMDNGESCSQENPSAYGLPVTHELIQSEKKEIAYSVI